MDVTDPARFSTRQYFQRLAGSVAAMFGLVAAVATIEPWLAGSSWLGLVASALLRLFPDLLGIGALGIGGWWMIRALRRTGLLAGSLTVPDWFFLSGLAVLSLFFLLSLFGFEYQRLRLLRYSFLGPGIVVERARKGEFDHAADAAAAVARFPFNRRFKTNLAKTERLLRSKSVLLAELDRNFDQQSAKMSPVRRLETSLWGLYLEPRSPRYQAQLVAAQEAWKVQRAAAEGRAANGPAFSVESSVALGLLRKDVSVAARLSPAALQAFERLRVDQGVLRGFEDAAAARTIESWLAAAESLRHTGKLEIYLVPEPEPD